MGEFIKKNKKTCIVFVVALVIVIASAVVGKIMTSDSTDEDQASSVSTINVSGAEYDTYGAGEIQSADDASAVSDTASDAVSSAASDAATSAAE
jgi:flagellar basal body-associated protein FliL